MHVADVDFLRDTLLSDSLVFKHREFMMTEIMATAELPPSKYANCSPLDNDSVKKL